MICASCAISKRAGESRIEAAKTNETMKTHFRIFESWVTNAKLKITHQSVVPQRIIIIMTEICCIERSYRGSLNEGVKRIPIYRDFENRGSQLRSTRLVRSEQRG